MLRYFLLVLAVLIVVSMAAYAASLWLKIHRNKKQLNKVKFSRYLSICESIEIIANAMQSGQCDLSEGALRLKPLLDVLGKPLSVYPAMWTLYQVVEEMPILDARKNLKRNERMKLDLERESKEIELEAAIQQELHTLLAQNAALKTEFETALK